MGILIKNFRVGHFRYEHGMEVFNDGPNSANGVGVLIKFVNKSNKTIKYADFYLQPYNAVGDAVRCTIKKISELSCEYTGPLGCNKKSEIVAENLWYNPNVSKVVINKVQLQYMDGTRETIKGKDIQYDSNAMGIIIMAVFFGVFLLALLGILLALPFLLS